jgi:hypothetical protein
MIDLLERAPDSWQMFQPQGSPASIHFYYGVTGSTRDLPLGSRFGVVYSPNGYVDVQSPLYPWHFCVFEVCLYQYRRTRPPERSYKVVKRRQLTRFEVPHFEALWFDILMMGRKTG